jgi:excisionase family DNA binding protein
VAGSPKNVARERLSAVNGGRRWASFKQTAEYIGVSERTIRLMVDDGRLTQYYLGPRIVRFDLNEVDAAMTTEKPPVGPGDVPPNRLNATPAKAAKADR